MNEPNPFEGLLGLTTWDWIWIVSALIAIMSVWILFSTRR